MANGSLTCIAKAVLAGVAAVAVQLTAAQAQSAPRIPAIHIIYMGGDDCPPCRAWRREELPKLEATAGFKRIKFTYVVKVIRSAVPPAFFMPSEVRPYKAKLDTANNGITGSPQTAILVDGKVFDYYFGTRSAEELEKMIAAIEDGTPYPFQQCVRRESQGRCEVRG